MKTMVPAITANALGTIFLSSLLILILTREFLRWKNSRPTKEQILASLRERIAKLQEQLTLLIAKLTWGASAEEEATKSRHLSLSLTSTNLLSTKALCDHMVNCLSKAIAYYPEDLRREIGGVEAAANIDRIKKDKGRYRAPKGKSATQTARLLKADEWK